MAEFIDIEDYDATIHREILDGLVRDDEALVEVCEDRAIEQMRSYMGQTYDCDRIFGARGAKRSQLVLMFALDIAVYHLFSIHNPHNMSQIRVDRYERAIAWLEGVQRGTIRAEGLPPAPQPDGAEPLTPFVVGSRPKSHNYFD